VAEAGCWLLLADAAGCCWLLLAAAAGCCWLLLAKGHLPLSCEGSIQ